MIDASFLRLGRCVCVVRVTMHVAGKAVALNLVIYLPPRGVADGNFMVLVTGLPWKRKSNKTKGNQESGHGIFKRHFIR